ncbi:hypothetical protein PBY51_003195 [Eleginops maclovinus]|uniref:Uncharacterized protein n=1 Tax=Eleginops maclovinus TaxID=56733 RepID=A0AAN7XG72_ELEMC|nr:hypothetical protein PBY51_003195 [Eleginops maclovinus]
MMQTDSHSAEGEGSIQPVCPAHGSASPDRRLCRGPCPAAAELHLPRLLSQANMSYNTAMRGGNRLNTNTLALSGPRHLQPFSVAGNEARAG